MASKRWKIFARKPKKFIMFERRTTFGEPTIKQERVLAETEKFFYVNLRHYNYFWKSWQDDYRWISKNDPRVLEVVES